ncbi:MAG: hypothetical protein CMK00_04300 [Planctomycetes bacterium]|nr:hypothetical protein [Planctomycetota bacterium]
MFKHTSVRPLNAVLGLASLTFLGLPLVLASGPIQETARHLPIQPVEQGHGQALPNPHRGAAAEPTITRTEDGQVRVETPEGPVVIKGCVRPTEDPEAHPEFGPSFSTGASGTRRGPGSAPGTASTGAGGPTAGGTRGPGAPMPGGTGIGKGPANVYPGCLFCHWEIENATENMMGGFELDCTFCHGGDPNATTKAAAHVHSDGSVVYDKRVPPLGSDLAYQKFINPSNLRTVDTACGICHPTKASDVKKSLMATNAGHLTGGFYQNNVVSSKHPIYGNFAIADTDGWVPSGDGALYSLQDMKVFDPTEDPALVSTHYAAVPSQSCARCHLWSRGKGYRGASGQDGVYRADGCVACHMPYANDGLSLSADKMIDHGETGHPKYHTITKQVPTEQCLHCHHRGARIGLTFTGRAQMPPRMPSGPGVPGTTDEKFNTNYHYTVADTNPPDIHHELGLHCIDCHTAEGVMGDGNIWGHMDQATKIECRACHGTQNSLPTLADNDGGVLDNVELVVGQGYVLTSKVTGAEHQMPTVMSAIAGNPTAQAAMNDDHIKASGGLECYACHTSWIPNCFGCHFERDEQDVGLNLMTNQYEVGKVTSSNKIFEALRHFSLGPNSEGRIAPYIVSCMPIADVTAPDGSKILDFKMPVTSNGLSGLAHNPVQPHSVRGAGEVRTCAECHRSPASLGLGSGNYAVARRNIFTAGATGLTAHDRKSDPTQPGVSGTTAGTALAVASQPDVVEGSAAYLFVAAGPAGVNVYDNTSGSPTGPVHSISGVNAIDVARAARYLYVVDAGVGIQIYDNLVPSATTYLSTVALPNAERVVPSGIHLFVAAGSTGLVIVNVADHAAPTIENTVGSMDAEGVLVYSHFQAGNDFAARAYVADPGYGVHVIDLLPNYATAVRVAGLPIPGATAVDAYSRWVEATTTEPNREHDYLFVAAGTAGLAIFDMTEPDNIAAVATVADLGGNVRDIQVSSALIPAGTDDYAYLANTTLGLQVVNVNDPTVPINLGSVPASPSATRLLTEVQQLDRFMDEQGNELKENSHPFITPHTHADIVRLLSVTLP